ncbi:MgtC/SapB family protein [Arthrobacter sp. 24S4-2]|uniref:MgtC/SapB family protein n=1 Tax=Arthrobacter sp. 24S4-2 TaxID=2575374 RepID=UPI0020C82E5C
MNALSFLHRIATLERLEGKQDANDLQNWRFERALIIESRSNMLPEFHYLIHLVMAFVLSTAIGIEREIHQKSAGLRTHMLVGVGSALFMIISKYGFNDISAEPEFSLDGSRVAAQVVRHRIPWGRADLCQAR